MCVIPAKSKALANGDPRQGSPLRLSSHITDGEISRQQPHSLRPLLVPFSHSAIYYCPTPWIVQSQGRYPTEIGSESPSPSPAWRGRGFSLRREPAEQPKQHILLPSQHSHTTPQDSGEELSHSKNTSACLSSHRSLSFQPSSTPAPPTSSRPYLRAAGKRKQDRQLLPGRATFCSFP